MVQVRSTACFLGMLVWGTWAVMGQGSLTPPGAPGESMKSLQQIWDSLQILQQRVQSNQTAVSSLSSQLKAVDWRVTQMSDLQGSAASLIAELARAQGLTVSNVWLTQTVDDGGARNVGMYTSLAFLPSGYPAVSYYDFSAEDLKYAEYDGAAWAIQTVDFSGSVGLPSSLAFTPSGCPAVAYFDGSNQTIKYAVLEGGAWTIQTVAWGVGTHSWLSLAFTHLGSPAIAYYNSSSSSLKYLEWSGSAWMSQTVMTSGNGLHVSLAFSPAGHAAMSYYCSGSEDLMYLENASNSWSYVWSGGAVDTAGDVGTHSSLVFSPAGHPSIAYFDVDGLNLKYAEHDGSAWRVSTVESAGAVGQCASLAYTPSGRPAISYGDATIGAVKYAERSGAAWQIQIVEKLPGTSYYTSLAFTPGGRPAVSYFDVSGSSLKYAEAIAVQIGP